MQRGGGGAVLEVVVGVALTALLGGLLVPAVKGRLDRNAEQYRAAVELLDTLATSLWTYWKLAIRVAYYGRQGEPGSAEFLRALGRWNSDEAWSLGTQIQIQVSKLKRLLPPAAHRKLDLTQRDVITYLDDEIDRRCAAGSPEGWASLHDTLKSAKREEIEDLLSGVIADLAIGTRRRVRGR
jgi:hypothetical protein